MKFSRKKNKKNIKPEFTRALFFLILIFLIVFLAISNVKIFQRRAEIKSQIKEKEEEIVSLYEESQEINERDQFDDYSIEKIAREQLMMKREGEKVVFINIEEEPVTETEKEEKEFIWWNPLTWTER